jgi:hypothetical protein
MTKASSAIAVLVTAIFTIFNLSSLAQNFPGCGTDQLQTVLLEDSIQWLNMEEV